MQEKTLKELTFEELEACAIATGITEEEWEHPEPENEPNTINSVSEEKEEKING